MYAVVVGDFGPVMPFALQENGSPFVLLDTDVVTFRYVDPADAYHEVSLDVVSLTDGTLSRTWVPGDLPVVGFYRGQIHVVRTDDVTFPRSYPNDGSTIIFSNWTALVTPA